MASVDNRIVKMEFDNASFEKNVNTTLGSLATLEKSLKLDGASKGLSDVKAESDKLNFGGLSSAIDNVSSKFTAMSAIGITALVSITSKAVDAGIQITKSLSLDQVMGGFSEYELKLGSIQTIMAGTGASLDEVNKKLNELNTYSDRTIYSFKDMTQNIGKFTNAGVSLDQSVQSIQGIAQLAAVSGANADEAARSMYNFAQALSRGNVELIDWKSIEMANMATMDFKKQLIETAGAAGELHKVNGQWVSGVKGVTPVIENFNDTLKNGWLTTEVLTKTLALYTDETTEFGKKAWAAAQDLKTFTQLVGVTKESIGSGWAQSFEVIFGNLDEAKQLWGYLGAEINSVVQKNATARNKMLGDWKALGGRFVLFETLKNLLENIGRILAPISQAFHDVFPPMTGKRLVEMTVSFSKLVDKLQPSLDTVYNLKRIFKGFFGVLEIGWTVLKEGVKFIGKLFDSITGAGSGKFLEFFGKIGDIFSSLNSSLVGGGGIEDFFAGLQEKAQKAITAIEKLADKIFSFFKKLGGDDSTEKTGDGFDRLEEKSNGLSAIFDKLGGAWKTLGDGFQSVLDVVKQVWDAISGFFTGLGKLINDNMTKDTFDSSVNALEVGLLGGITAALVTFVKKGIRIDLTGGMFEKINKMFETLTGTLKAFQTKIKADALRQIAVSIAILTASVLVLSLIDAQALAKGLGAMAVGFGQLMGAFVLLNKITMKPGSALNFVKLAAGMILLSSAMFVLSVSAKIFGSMDWEEFARGMAGLGIMLGMVIAMGESFKNMKGDLAGTGVTLLFLAISLNILALAVKQFATLSLEELGKGLLGAAGGLVILVTALNKMPKMSKLSSLMLLAVAGGLKIIAGAVEIFAAIPFGDLVKGVLGMGAAMGALAGALHALPDNMVSVGVGFLLVTVALNLMVKAISDLGAMSFGDLVQGVLATVIVIESLSAAAQSMEKALPGAAAMLIISGALMVMAEVVKHFSDIKWQDLVWGLAGIAAVLGVIGGVAYLLQPAVGAMIGLGIAMLALGAGFALFGIGVKFIGEGFIVLSKVTREGAKNVLAALLILVKGIPEIAAEMAKGLLQFLKTFVEGTPDLIKIVVKLIEALLTAVEKVLPKLLKVLGEVLGGIIKLITEKYVPLIVKLGLAIIMSLVQGIRDNIGRLVTLVGEIITRFIDALSVQIPSIVKSISNFMTKVLTAVAEDTGRTSVTLMPSVGMALIQGILDGMAQMIGQLWPWIKEQFGKIIDIIKGIFGINSPSTVMMDIGVDIIMGLFNGIVDTAVKIKDWFLGLAGKVLEWIGDVARWLWDTGVGILESLSNGILEGVKDVKDWFLGLGDLIIGWISDATEWLLDVGKDIMAGLLEGIEFYWDLVGGVKDWIVDLPKKIVGLISKPFEILQDVGEQIIRGLKQGLLGAWHLVTDWVSEQMEHLKHLVTHPWEVLSPSKYMIWVGEMIMGGLAIGLEHDSEVEASIQSFGSKMKESIASIVDSIETEYKPVITPVIEMSALEKQIQEDIMYLGNTQYGDAMFALGKQYRNPYDPSMSQAQYASLLADLVNQAKYASLSYEDRMKSIMDAYGGGGVTYQQNIYAPTQLSTSDIYKQTRNQITIAKEELSIP